MMYFKCEQLSFKHLIINEELSEIMLKADNMFSQACKRFFPNLFHYVPGSV